jgi:hypothetical protein
MKKDRLSNRDLSLFNLLDIQRFLENENWHLIEKSTKALIYQGFKTDSDKTIEIILPSSETNYDYYERISDFINLISNLKEIDAHKVINLISLTSHDILQMRIMNPGEHHFSLPLDVAATEVNALKSLFTYSACSEENARPYFDYPSTAGINHANQCQFGHTFEGSFGFTINSPIISDYSQLHLFGEKKQAPFERKVMERIINGFLITQTAIEKEDASIIVDNFETGFNSRMCDALVDISMEKTKNVEFKISWSYQIPPQEDINKFDNIVFNEKSYEMLQFASEELKKVEPFEDTIIGKIVTLHLNKSPFSDEDFPRTAIVKHQYEGRSIEVKLELSKEGYKKVYQAHGEGKTVKIIGNLFKKGSTWRMIDISNIELLYQSP